MIFQPNDAKHKGNYENNVMTVRDSDSCTKTLGSGREKGEQWYVLL